MNVIKKLFTSVSGYWIHKISTLPAGADINVDMHHRIKYGELKVVFDVGANVGQTWEWIRYLNADASIYCFEPVKSTFKQLQQKAGHDKNCVLENIAFGDVAGEKRITLYDEHAHHALNSLKDELMNHEAGARAETIKVETVDTYCHRNNISKIDFLKIDTEGYEINVLEGAARMLDNAAVSMIFCEVGMLKSNTRNTNFSELSEWLAKKDYYFFGMYQMVANGWKEGHYFGNALFVHKDVFNP